MASKIQAALQEIANQHDGILRPEIVVDAARAKTSPLHSSFEWDNTKAAEAHRLWQARQLIISVTIKYEGVKNESPIYVSLKKDRETGGGYRPMVAVLADDELREQLLEDARQDMEIFRKKYRGLKQLAKVFEAMDEV
jgi:hypothetical protein